MDASNIKTYTNSDDSTKNIAITTLDIYISSLGYSVASISSTTINIYY